MAAGGVFGIDLIGLADGNEQSIALAGASVAPGGLVYVRSTAGVGENLGDCRAADDSTDTDPIDSNAAQFTGQKIAALNLAVVELNLP